VSLALELKQTHRKVTFFFVAQQPLLGQGLLVIEASQSHSDTPRSVGLLLTSDKPAAETSTCKHTTLTRERDILVPGEFEPAIQEAICPR